MLFVTKTNRSVLHVPANQWSSFHTEEEVSPLRFDMIFLHHKLKQPGENFLVLFLQNKSLRKWSQGELHLPTFLVSSIGGSCFSHMRSFPVQSSIIQQWPSPWQLSYRCFCWHSLVKLTPAHVRQALFFPLLLGNHHITCPYPTYYLAVR